MDVHKDSISIGILRPDDSLDVERIFHDEESVRWFIARMGEPRRLTACYEAGPTGYELERLLKRLQVRCDVVAPSLIPKAPGDRVKTDRRDCRRLARLHRAGELTPIRVPTREEEARSSGSGRRSCTSAGCAWTPSRPTCSSTATRTPTPRGCTGCAATGG
jgi:transposase